jgi:dTDP-4-dehydrorhamnose reductase
MTWLILGSSGQLGIALSQELESRGITFRSRSHQELDITEELIVRVLIEELSPKVVINCAAWTDVDGAEASEEKAFLVNSQGVENIAKATKACGAKLVHISTDYVFSGHSDEPWKEADLKQPLSAYGRSKAAGEDKAQGVYSEGTYIIRTAWLYSPWGKNFVKTMTRIALFGKNEIKVVIDQLGQPTSAQDLAKQIVELGLSNAPAGIYHGTNMGSATRFEFAREIFKLVGEDTERVTPVTSGEYLQAAKRPSYSVLGNDNWLKTSMNPMRNWQIALAEAMPAIISAVQAEE